MEEVSLNSVPLFENEGNGYGMEGDCSTIDSDGQYGLIHGKKETMAPAVGMEFESYDDAYNFYNCYAKELGFGVRVKNSCTRKKSKEKCLAVLCCSSQGFKPKRETARPRPEIRVGCPAMVRIKLMDSRSWKVTEVVLEHNHLISPESVRFYRSHKKMGAGTKRNLQHDRDETILTNKSYKKFAVDLGDFGNFTSDTRGYINQHILLKLREGDVQTISNYFCHMQLKSPNFFYLMDLSEEGHLRNIFWADASSRAAYRYFGDVVVFDTTYLTKKYELPLTPFVGVNHHGQPVLLGCGLVAGETIESFVWLFKAWLACMLGSTPSVIITDQCWAIQRAIAAVFPKACHRYCLWHIMQKVPEILKGLHEYEAIKGALHKAVYDSLREDEFETAWVDMIQRYGVCDHEWLKLLYEDRQRWVPVFLKDTFFASMSTIQRSESMNAFFDGYVHKQTLLKEFFDKYELFLQSKHEKEARADFESRHSNPVLKTRCCFELQLSKVYTREIFKKFQYEVEEMFSCFNTTQVNVDGPITIYIVKERVESDENRREIKDYEVLYNKADEEICCICNLFNFKGYLCRHALSVLNFNGVEEVPSKYILSRWRKDFKHTYISSHNSNDIDVNHPVQWSDHLYKHATQVVEEGLISQERYKVALQALEESLNKVRGV